MKRSKDSETMALEALGFIASDEQELGRFSGSQRARPSRRCGERAGTREVMAAALGHVLGYEPIAKGFRRTERLPARGPCPGGPRSRSHVVTAPVILLGRPLVVCDADEVLLQFLAGLEAFLPATATGWTSPAMP